MRGIVPLLFLAVACASPARQGPDAGKWVEAPRSHARCFAVLRDGDARRLLVFASPDHKDTLADLRGTEDGLPIERLAALSTTHLPFIRALGREHRIVAAAFIDRSRDERLIRRMKAGEVVEVATADGVDRERLASARVDAVLDYPFGRSRLRSASMRGTFIPVLEYQEDHPLGRAEWIRFFGALLGREALADSLFAMIEQRYHAEAAMAKGAEGRPRVFFGSAWQGQWHMPPGGSYMARLIMDAGGDYAFAQEQGTANIALPLERVYMEARNSDLFGVILAHGGVVSALELAGDQRLAEVEALRSGGFYLDSERSDVFGQALLEPDALLSELRCIFRNERCGHGAHRYVFRPRQ